MPWIIFTLTPSTKFSRPLLQDLPSSSPPLGIFFFLFVFPMVFIFFFLSWKLILSRCPGPLALTIFSPHFHHFPQVLSVEVVL